MKRPRFRSITIILFLSVLAIWDTPLLAQQTYNITGIVREADTQNILPGASVYIAGTQKGTTTNSDGKYNLPLEAGQYRLVASFIGFKSDTLTITVGPDKPNQYNFSLQPTVIEGEEVVVYADRVARRVRELANLRNKEMKTLDNYSVKINKLGLLYETRKSKQNSKSGSGTPPVNSHEDASLGENTSEENNIKISDSVRPSSSTNVPGEPIAFSERVVQQLYVAPNSFTEKYLARRSSKNFFSEYELFSTGGSPLNLNDDKVELNILSEVVTVVGPISESAPIFYNLSDEPADSTWPKGTTKIIIMPKTNSRPLFKGEVFVNDETDKIIGMDLKMNQAGEVYTGVYSMSDFSYYQKYEKVKDYWLPARTEIQGRIGIIGFKNDFIFRDIWNYSEYEINRNDLSKGDIPLSDMIVAQSADSRDSTYWNETISNYNLQDIQQLKKAQSYDENRFLVNFLMGAFRAYYRAPTFLENSYFTNVSDFYRFNRVEGHYVGAGLRTPAVKDNFSYKGAVGHATEGNDWRYYIEGLQFIGNTPLAVEASYYKKLAIQFADYEYKVSPLNVDEFRYTIQAGFSGFDPRNYFERKGYKFGLRWHFREHIFLRANYMQEDQKFLPIVAPNSFFNDFEVGGDIIDPNLNPRVGITPDGSVGTDGLEGFTEGEFSGFEFQLHFDNRQFRQNGVFRNYDVRKFGWFTDHLAYWSDPDFDIGSSSNDGFNYIKYRSAFGMRIPMFASNFLLSEIYIGGTNQPLPAQMQFSNNGFYIEDYIRRRPFITLGFNEGIGNRVTAARIDYDFGSSLVRRLMPFRFIRRSGMQVRVWGAAGYRHGEPSVSPVTPWTDGAQEQIEVGVSVTHILGIFSAEVGFRIDGNAGDSVGLTVIL